MMLFPMAIITLFWKDQIGLSLTEIMFLQAVFALASLCLEFPSGYISDRLGYRFSLSLASLLGLIGWALYNLANSFIDVLVAEIVLGISFAFISGSDSALLFESLRQSNREEHYSRLEGRMTGWAQSGEAVGAISAGLLYAAAPILPFAIQIAVWIVALLVTLQLRDAPPAEKIQRSHFTEMLEIWKFAWLENAGIRSTILLSTCLGLASFYPVWLIQPFMQQSGVPLGWFGPVWAGANLTVAVFSVLSHRVTSFLGARGQLKLFFLLGFSGLLGLGLSLAVFSFLFYYLLTAMRGLQSPFSRHYLQVESNRSNRASLLSLKAFSFRLGFVLTGPIVGFCADRYGLNATFLFLAMAFLPLYLILARSFYRNNCLTP
ncbi:MAG: MFS transporter [Desulfuromonas sp.]|nr:MAG: MFS transporter [Desulfuromonas sp.]